MPSPLRLVLLACLALSPAAVCEANPQISDQVAADGEETVIDLGPTTDPSTGPHLCMAIRCWHDARAHRHCAVKRFVGANAGLWAFLGGPACRNDQQQEIDQASKSIYVPRVGNPASLCGSCLT